MGLQPIIHKGLDRLAALLCALFLAVTCLATPSVSHAAEASIAANGYKMAGDATKMRIVINYDREPNPKWFLLRGPHRLVVDLPNTKLSFSAKDLKARGLVKACATVCTTQTPRG